jgi:hypothetical protein
MIQLVLFQINNLHYFIIYFNFKGIELSTHVSISPDLQIPFYCGNHLVDITRGILHLYKDK